MKVVFIWQYQKHFVSLHPNLDRNIINFKISNKMKFNKIFSALMLIAAVMFTACETPEIVGPGPQPNGQDTTKTDTAKVEHITIAKAIEIANALEPTKTTAESYELRGKVTKVLTKASELVGYGNLNFELTDNTGSIGCYYINYLNNEKFTSADQILAVGDSVVVISPLKNYVNKSGESIPEAANGYLQTIVKNTPAVDITYEDDEISVAKALELGATLNGGDTLSGTLKVRGIVKKEQVNISYGSATFYLSDGTNELYCYNITGLDGAKLVSGKQLVENDIVTVEARLYNFVKEDKSTLELIKGNITRTTNTFDPSTVEGPKKVTVAEAYAEGSKLAQGETSADQYEVKGVITKVEEASTSYGNATFYIQDANGTQEMYCYRLRYIDNKKYSDADPTIEAGDVVTVIAQIKNYNGKPQFASGYISEHVK